MKINEFITILKEKDEGQEIEFLVATEQGQIIAAFVEKQVKPMQKMLKLFGK